MAFLRVIYSMSEQTCSFYVTNIDSFQLQVRNSVVCALCANVVFVYIRSQICIAPSTASEISSRSYSLLSVAILSEQYTNNKLQYDMTKRQYAFARSRSHVPQLKEGIHSFVKLLSKALRYGTYFNDGSHLPATRKWN